MDLLEDPTFKIKYQKSKLRVKRWESEFMEKFGRKPKKDDIRAADNSIRESYKMYYTLKTRALEETLLDITFTDEVQTNVVANTSVNTSSNVDKPVTDETNKLSSPVNNSQLSPESAKNAENIDPEKSENVAIPKIPMYLNAPIASVTTDDSPNVDGAWGEHLNNDKNIVEPVKKKPLTIGRTSSFQLSQKMFSASNLTKRNPRKSLSMSKLKSSKSENNLNGSTVETNNEKPDGFDVDPSKSLFGEVKVVQGEKKFSAQPINAIQQLIKGAPAMANRSINQGWLERCTRENGLEPIPCNPQRLSGTSDSGIESMDLSSGSPPIDSVRPPPPQSSANISSDEDFICNSDSEEERRNKRVRNFRKRLSDGACQQDEKRQKIDTDDYFSFSQPLPNKITVGLSPPVVREATVQPIQNLGTEKVNTIQDAKILAIEVATENKTAIADQEKSINKIKATEQTELEPNAEVTDKKKRVIRKPRVPRRKVKADEEAEEEEEDEDEWEPQPKKRVRKTTRTGVSRRKVKAEDVGETARERKPRAARKSAPRKRIQPEESPDEEIIKETTDGPEIPIYGIESTNVVPRFALPTSASGDLVTDFSQSVAPGAAGQVVSAPKLKTRLTDREKLEAKVASGKVNENFVRINLKKKVFVRGKKNFNFSKYKKNQWKQRKKDLSSSEAALDLADFAEKTGANTCYKCGEMGHYARQCRAMKSEGLLPDDGEEVSSFPTLEEAEKMALQNKVVAHGSKIDRLPVRPSFSHTKDAEGAEKIIEEGERGEESNEEDSKGEEDYDEFFEEDFDGVPQENSNHFQGHKIPEDLLAKLLPPATGVVDPVFDTPAEVPETPDEVKEALRMFGHESFRPGQEKAIMRVLSGKSTLVTLSTGSGKSLCYQLPAYIYAKRSQCITLVVSPLVSLMDDQVVGVPSFLSAAALHTGQSASVKEKIMDTIKQGKLDILLVSPEAVVAGEKSTGFGALLRQLPPIAFACIDEAHCISQWSHNFRPSYLMICRVLIEKLGVKTILGLTATATKSTAESIIKHLDIRDGLAGVISDTPMPKNLTLTVSKDEHRDRALVDLLLSERFKECDSIIVYCTRREECTRIAGVIRMSLQDPRAPQDPKAKCSKIAEAYHAGLTASRRKIIQKSFMSGQTRVVVATVAFGMGINKANIRSVIHYNMPASFEGYVQEVGRAGRDNLPAHCHLFLAPSKEGDKLELRRHIFADGVDRHMIRRLLQKIFVPCSCPRAKDSAKRCPGHEVAISVADTVRSLDITEETIATLLCYLELHPKRFITVLSSVYVNAKVSSYAGAKALKAAAQASPPLAMAIALDLKKGISHDNSTVVEFPVVDVAAAIGWDSGVVKSHLKNLEWITVDGHSKRSPISVRYDTLGLRVRAPGDLTDVELDEALEALAGRARDQESAALRQLDAIHAALSKYSVPSIRQCMNLNEEMTEKSECLKEIIREYFRSDKPLSVVELPPQVDPSNEAEIVGDVRRLISSYRDTNFTGRAVARIFHGIQSPNYPALAWSRCRFWRAHLSTDFNFICRIATKEILAMR